MRKDSFTYPGPDFKKSDSHWEELPSDEDLPFLVKIQNGRIERPKK